MSIWDKFPHVDDAELRELVIATVHVLQDSADDIVAVDADLLDISPLAASRQLLPLLSDEEHSLKSEQVQMVLEDQKLARRLSIEVLHAVRQQPELSARVAKTYEDASQKLATPEVLLAVGALVILAMKLKEIRLSGGEAVISFYEAGEAVKSFVRSLMGGGGAV